MPTILHSHARTHGGPTSNAHKAQLSTPALQCILGLPVGAGGAPTEFWELPLNRPTDCGPSGWPGLSSALQLGLKQ